MSAEYSQVRTEDGDAFDLREIIIAGDGDDERTIDIDEYIRSCEEEKQQQQQQHHTSSNIRNKASAPISRPPSKHRDRIFAAAFGLHLVLLGVLSASIEDGTSMRSSLTSYGRNGSWSQILMIMTLLGAFSGAIITFFVNNAEMRDGFLKLCLVFSIVLQLLVGNVLLIMKSRYSPLGAVALLSALHNMLKYRMVSDSIHLTSTLLHMVIEVCGHYGFVLTVACVLILALQTCVLLWWGACFVGILSGTPESTAWVLLLVLFASLSWITQFFRCLVSYVIGGCVVWYFVRDEAEPLDPGKRVLLHLQCALSTSLGSLCKGALLSQMYMLVLSLEHWGRGRPGSVSGRFSLRRLVQGLVAPVAGSARRHHRLALCLTATYGKTLCTAAGDYAERYPETIALAIEDLTGYSLGAASTCVSGLLALLSTVLVDNSLTADATESWPLLFAVNFYVAFSGMALVTCTYRGAVDALVVVFAEEPLRLAKENQIIFLRFLRQTERALQ